MSRFCFFELREGRMFWGGWGGGGLEEHGMRKASKWCWFVEPRRWRKNVFFS
jgi:hypothetical protein